MTFKKSFLVAALVSVYSLTVVSSQDPIFSMLTSDKIDEMEYYLESNSSSVSALNQNGETPLFQAIKNNNTDAVYALLMAGASANIKNLQGVTPLIFVAMYAKNKKTMKTLISDLIQLGSVNINFPDNQGKTPLHYAVEQKKDFTVKMLVENGADVNAQDFAGETPLMDALSEPDNVEIVNLLMAGNPRLNLVNNWNETLFHFALKHQGYEELVQYLLTVGLNPFELNSDGQVAEFNGNYLLILQEFQKKLDEFKEFQELSNFLNKIPTNNKCMMVIGKNQPDSSLPKPIAQKKIPKRVTFSSMKE